MSEELTDTLKRLREEKGYSMRALSSKANMSNSYYSEIESGKKKPSAKILYRLSTALGVNMNVLLGREVKSDELKDLKPHNSVDVVLIPIVGEVRAGTSMYAQNNIQGYKRVEKSNVNPNKTYFYLNVIGDSMDKLINENDTVLVEHTGDVETGDIVIALVDYDNATIKRLKLHKDSIELIPESTNRMYEPRKYKPEEIEIIGKVIKAERYF